MKHTFLVLIVACAALGCRSQYEKMVNAKSAAVDQMYTSAQTTLNSFDTEDKYLDKDTIVSIELLDIDFRANESEISAINYATIYHYMLLLQEYPNSILKVVGYDLENEKKEETHLSKARATEIKTRLVKGFSIPEPRILISSKSKNTCACAKVKLIQPHLAFSTKLELLKETGDSLVVPISFNETRPRENHYFNILTDFLREHPNRKYEFNVHTDSRANDEDNLALSEKRAENLVVFLTEKGAKPGMLTGSGYGEKQPVNHCSNGVDCTDAEHEENKRVVLKRL